MTNDAMRFLSPHIAIRLFVVVLAVIAGRQAVQADVPQTEAGPPVAIDLAAARNLLTQEVTQTPSLTPIRRATDPLAEPGERASPSSLTSTLALLGLVLGGAYVGLNVLRRRQTVRSAQTHVIDLLASRRLDGQSTLHLVHIGRRVLAVGSSAGGTRTLAVIEDPEEIAQLISMSGDRGRNTESPVNSSAGTAEPGRGSRRAERAWTTGLFSGSAEASLSHHAGSEGLMPPVGFDGKKRPA